MTAVPRKSGRPLSRANSRGVLLASSAAKVYSRALRTAVAEPFARAVEGWQAGAVTKGGTEVPAQTVQWWIGRAVLARRSAAVLFTDLRAAFYRAMSEQALGPLMPAARRREVLLRAGLSAAEPDTLEDSIVQGPSGLELMGVDPLWCRLLRDWHVAAHFGVPGGGADDQTIVALALAGVRPGDSTADLIFAVVMLSFQRDLWQRLRAAGLVWQLPCQGQCVWPDALEGEEEEEEGWLETPVTPPTFMDDLALPVGGSTGIEVLANAEAVLECVRAAARSCGFEVNLDPGKTELVAHLAGPGLQAAKQYVRDHAPAAADGQCLAVLPSGLRLVAAYKHLGIWADSAQTNLREVTARASGGLAAVAALGRRVLGQRRLPQRLRVQAASAACNARALQGAGLWGPLGQQARSRIDAAVMAPFRRIAGAQLPQRVTQRAHHKSNEEVRRELGIAPPRAQLDAARLRYFGRAWRRAPRCWFALAQSKAAEGWRRELVAAMGAMRALLRPRLDELPAPTDGPPAGVWERWARRWPRQWAALVARFVQAAVERPLDYERIAATLRDEEVKPAIIEGGGFLCERCVPASSWPSSASLRTHQQRVHGDRCEVRCFVPGRVCPICGRSYASRLRCLHHIKRDSPRCLAAVQAGAVPRLAAAELAERDAIDRKLRQKCAAVGVDVLSPAAVPFARELEGY